MSRESWSPLAATYDPLLAGSIDGTDTVPHDRAIVRALNATYRPNKGVTGDCNKTIFVARLNPDTTENTIKSTFAYFGDIKRVRLVRDIVTGFSKCYAFVEFLDEKCAEKASMDGNRMEIDGKMVFVETECERTLQGWIPRRLGGGLSGRKESGQLRFGGKDRPFRKPIFITRDQQNRPAISDTFRQGSSSEYNTGFHRDRGRYRSRDTDRSYKDRSSERHRNDRESDSRRSERSRSRGRDKDSRRDRVGRY